MSDTDKKPISPLDIVANIRRKRLYSRRFENPHVGRTILDARRLVPADQLENLSELRRIKPAGDDHNLPVKNTAMSSLDQ
jgi:hypothetical protein